MSLNPFLFPASKSSTNFAHVVILKGMETTERVTPRWIFGTKEVTLNGYDLKRGQCEGSLYWSRIIAFIWMQTLHPEKHTIDRAGHASWLNTSIMSSQ